MATSPPTYNRRRSKRAALAKLGVTERRPRSGHNVSHAQNKTKRLFRPNLQKAKILVDGKLVSVRVPASVLRSLSKQVKERAPKAPKKRAGGRPASKKAAPRATAGPKA